MYNLLGLKEEDETVMVLRQAANDANAAPVNDNSSVIDDNDTEGAALPVDDHAPVEQFTFFDRDNPEMAVGDTFPSMDTFRMALKHYAIRKEFDIKINMSQPKKYVAYCKAFEEGCPWSITAKKKQESSTVVVTELEDKHMCASSSRKKTSMASQSWVAERAEIIMKNDPDMSAIDLQKKLQNDYNVKVSYHTVYKGRQRAIVDLYGSWEESFRLLYNFKAEIELRSPGSVVEIATKKVEGKIFFDKFFIAFKPCIDGFLSGCRPYLSIDSTHLNGKWNGHLGAVTALDGHNWMFPVAFGFFDAETTENWNWFMSQLKKAIGDPPVLAVCTDACKGLENAVKNVFPNAEQRECFRHLMGNAVKKFRGEKFSHMWPAAKAYKKSKFHWHMKQVFMEEPKVLTYLELHHNLLWMRCMFNTDIKVDYIHNNIAECFNSWVRQIKDLPIVQLCDKLREMVMELFRKRRRIGERLQGKILPAIIQELNNRTRGLGHLKPHVSSDWSAEVKDTEKDHIRHVVKVVTRECTCLEWQHTGKPCPHALVVLTALPNVKLEDFLDDYYSVEKFRAAYQGEIEPLTDKSQWPKVDPGFVLHAPLPKRGAGRHRKLRIKGALEGGVRE